MQKTMIMLILSTLLFSSEGEEVFRAYCWGCHHQSAVAFGPPFEEIAAHRSSEEIRAMITDPQTVSKQLGYRRNAMPPFRLSEGNLSAITHYILSYKPESNQTIVQESNTTKGNQ